MSNFEDFHKFIKSYEVNLIEFRNGSIFDFLPSQYQPKEDGYYFTIRCGLTGLYTRVDMWKNGSWSYRSADGSNLIARSRNPLNIPE